MLHHEIDENDQNEKKNSDRYKPKIEMRDETCVQLDQFDTDILNL